LVFFLDSHSSGARRTSRTNGRRRLFPFFFLVPLHAAPPSRSVIPRGKSRLRHPVTHHLSPSIYRILCIAPDAKYTTVECVCLCKSFLFPNPRSFADHGTLRHLDGKMGYDFFLFYRIYELEVVPALDSSALPF